MANGTAKNGGIKLKNWEDYDVPPGASLQITIQGGKTFTAANKKQFLQLVSQKLAIHTITNTNVVIS